MEYNFKLESDRKRFYNSSLWRGVNGARNRALKRDNHECQWCKRDGLVTTSSMGTLEVDHILELEHCTLAQAVDLDNLRTLCTAHHNERHNRFDGKHYIPNKWADDEKW